MRSGVDRRTADHGPPAGVPERRQHQRRSHDRRSAVRPDRRVRDRRHTTGRRGGSAAGARHRTRAVAAKPYVVPPTPVVGRTRTAKIVRAVVITLVALACLLAATLTEPPGGNATTAGLADRAAQVLQVGDAADGR